MKIGFDHTYNQFRRAGCNLHPALFYSDIEKFPELCENVFIMKWRLDPGQIEVVDDKVAEVLRRKTPGERMVMVSDGWRFAETWISGVIRSQHKDWDETKVIIEVKRRLHRGTN